MSTFTPDDLQMLVQSGRFSPQYAQQYANNFQLQVPNFIQNGMEPQTAEQMPEQYVSNEQAAPEAVVGAAPIANEAAALPEAQWQSQLPQIQQSANALMQAEPKNIEQATNQQSQAIQLEALAAQDEQRAREAKIQEREGEYSKIKDDYYGEHGRITEAQKDLDSLQRAHNESLDYYQNFSIDPWNPFKGDRGAIAAISAALGTFGAALSGQPNHVMNLINKQIDQDTERQKLEFAKARDIVNARRESVRDKKDDIRELDAHAIRAQELTRSRYAALLDDISDKYKNTTIGLNAAKVSGQIKAQMFKDRQDRSDKFAIEGMKINAARQQAREKALSDIHLNNRRFWLTGDSLPSTAQVDAANEADAALETYLGLLDEAKKVLKDPLLDAFTKKSTLESLNSNLLTAIQGQYKQIGTLDNQAERVGKDFFGGDLSDRVALRDKVKLIEDAERRAVNKAASIYNNAGIGNIVVHQYAEAERRAQLEAAANRKQQSQGAPSSGAKPSKAATPAPLPKTYNSWDKS